jgi:hypothetical protein
MGMRYGYHRYPRKVFTGAVMRGMGCEKGNSTGGSVITGIFWFFVVIALATMLGH